MWFSRKPQNRRLGRQQVLEVKLRSSQVRAVRTRRIAIGLGALFASVFGLYLVYRVAEWGLNRLVYDNKAFAIQEVDVQTDGVISVDQLRRWAGVKPEENLLALDLARVRRDLQLIPLVQSVSVERILPHTLRIRITEREPIAQVNVHRLRAGGGLDMAVYHLDPSGWVLVPLETGQRAVPPSQADEALPVIHGVNPHELQPGRRLTASQVQAALKLLATFSQSAMAGLVDIRRVDVSAPEVLVVTTGQGSEVTFGLTDFERDLRRWQTIFELGQKLGSAIATLDLAVTNNTPLRWMEASASPSPLPPDPPKPLHLKKRHV
jgi:cell division septal protein FtsQ